MISSAFIPGPPQWLTVSEAADLLDLSVPRIHALSSAGRVSKFRAPWNERQILIPRADLERYDEERRANAPWLYDEEYVSQRQAQIQRAAQRPLFHICPRCSIIVDEPDQLCQDCQRELAGVPYYTARADVLEPAVDLARCYEMKGAMAT